MRELVNDVYTWCTFSERHGYDFNGWLVRHPDGHVIVDPVAASDAELADLVALGARYIVLTNRNHGRASLRFRALLGAQVLVHAADRAHVEAQGTIVDATLAVGDRIGPFTVLDASGKSPGELALHWPERRLLLVGDACVGNPPGRLSLLPNTVIDDTPRLRANLARIARTVDFDAILCGDGVSILTGAHEALAALVATFPLGLGGAAPILFSATTAADRARAFYEGVLGLELRADEPFALVFDVAGTTLRIQKVAALTPQPFTLLGWEVRDITAKIGELAARGVRFEQFEGLGQDAAGIWTAPGGARVAWFKDPDGNLLSLTEAGI